MAMNAKDPSGKVHTYTGTREVAFAVFNDNGTPGVYTAKFCKTLEAAKRVWGADGKGYTRVTRN